jgi:signal transduction histidine kinase
MQSIIRMKIFHLVALCCFLFSSSLRAQNKRIDSLLMEIKKLEIQSGNVTADTNLIRAYYAIADEYYFLEDRVKEQNYTKKAVDFGALMLDRNATSTELKKYLLHKKAIGYGNIATYYKDISDYPKALDFYFKAMKIDEGIGNKEGLLRHLGNIAIAFNNLGEYQKAIDYTYRSLAIAKQLNFTIDEATLYSNLGSGYVALENNVMALQYYNRAMEMFRNLKDTGTIAMILGNIGNVYGNFGDNKLDNGEDPKKISEYDTAVAYYKKSLGLYEITGDKRNKALHLGSLGSLYLSMKKYDDAKIMLFKSLELSEEIDDLDGIMETNKNLSQLYSDKGDSKKAFEYYKNYIIAKDSVFNEENTKKNVTIEMNFEFEKKNAIQMAEHEKEVIALEAENRIQKNTRNFIVLLAIMSLLLVASGFVYFNNRKALQLRELYSHQLLLSQEKERQRISKELHDSIGQNMLFIKNQMIKNNDLRLMSSVDETLEEVRNISKDLYPNQLEKYGLIAAVDALAEKVKESSNVFVSFDLDAIDKNISADKQINFYRIIQECITNALKHADASALRITASQMNGNLELVIQDNGKGFDKEILSKKAQLSFGLLNLEERVKHLKGRLILETSPGKGTKYIFSIPS